MIAKNNSIFFLIYILYFPINLIKQFLRVFETHKVNKNEAVRLNSLMSKCL